MEGFSKCIKYDLEKMSDYQVELTRVVKNGDASFYGVALKKEDEAIAPTIYLNEYYHRYLYDDLSLECIVQHILESVKETPKHSFNEDMFKVFFDFESVKDKIVYRLYALEENKEFLQGTPYVPFHDMAIVFYYLVEKDERGMASIKITNMEMKMWKVTIDELFELAKLNTKRLFPLKIQSMEECIVEMMGGCTQEEQVPTSNLYVLTNQIHLNGAATILYENVLRDFANQMECDFFLLPSSIHEMLLVKKDEICANEQLYFYKELVREQNMCLPKNEKLTDSVYLYERDTQEIRMM